MSQPEWVTVKEYGDITYRKSNGVGRIASGSGAMRDT